MATIFKEKRPSDTGGHRWVANVRMRGHNVKRRFDSRGEAKIWARATEVSIEEGRYDIVRRQPMEVGKKTLQTIVDIYLADIDFDKQPKTSQDYEDGLKVQRAAELLRGPIEQINSGQIYDAFSKLTSIRSGKPLAPSSIGKYFDSCIKMMDVAIGLEWFSEWQENRFTTAKRVASRKGAVKPSAERERVRVEYLTDWTYTGSHPDYKGKVMSGYETDMIKLEAEIDWPYMIPMIDFAMSSSMRMTHIWRLEWKDIDMSDPDMVLVTRLRKDKKLQTARKSDLTEIAPLSDEAGELIRELAKQGTEGRVFKGSPEWSENVGKQFIELSKRLGFYKTGLTFHVMRHEACSRFHEQDLPEQLIMAYTGHRGAVSLKRYTHLRPSTKVNKWKAMREA
jgi:integrase